MSTVDTSTWSPDTDFNVEIEGIPLNADAGIEQTWQVLRILMAAFKGDGDAIKSMIDVMQGATATADGASGLVPKPEAGDQDKVLKGDGTWGDNIVGNAATATRLAGPKHSYTTAANAAKNWYRIANANTHQMDTSKPLQVQFMLTAWNPDQPADYYEQWFVDCQVYGRNSGMRIFGASSAPFSHARVLYENTVASIDTSDRPAIDIYLNYVLATACQIRIEEIYNSGWTFPADGVLAASTIPSGFENRAVGVQGSGVHQATNASYTTYTSLQRSNITANITLANSDTYRMRVLNCTNQITVTVPSIDNTYAWFLIKNFNAVSTNKNVTVHPSTTSVLIDDSNADIILKPGEWAIIASKAANSYSLIGDGRWKSQKADKATTLAGYGITDAKIANGTITLGSNSITPLTSVPSHNQASNTINAMTGYSKPDSTSAIAATDSLNVAVGKLEKALDGKQASGSYAAASHSHGSITNDGKLGTASRAVVTDANGAIDVSSVTATELGYLSGATSNVQTQLNAKATDSEVMHLAGSEVVSGEKQFQSTVRMTVKDLGFKCEWGSYSMAFKIGSGGVNRGVWDYNLNKWVVYSNDSNCYFNGTVNQGSDERLKTKIQSIKDDALDAWDEVRWVEYKYKTEKEAEGIHAGLVAQRIVEAFARHGVSAEDYQIVARERHEDGSDGYWMVRYIEAFAMEAACQRRRADALERRIAILEAKLSKEE